MEIKKVVFLLWFFLFLYIALPAAHSQEKNFQYEKYTRRKPENPVSPLSLSYMFLVLAIMGTSIVFLVWFLKKLTKNHFAKTKSLVLKESLYLGNKSYLHVVEIAGSSFVLGATPHSIQTIAQIPLQQPLPCFEKALNQAIEKQETLTV